MQILVNNQSHDVNPDFTVSQLLQYLQQPLFGTAVAINQKVISRSKWDETFLQEHDSVLIIKATCGG